MIWEVKGRSSSPLLKSSAILRCSPASTAEERSVMNLAGGGGSPGKRVWTTGALGVTSGETTAIVAGGLVADGTAVTTTSTIGGGSGAVRLATLQARAAAARRRTASAGRRRSIMERAPCGGFGLEDAAARPGWCCFASASLQMMEVRRVPSGILFRMR